VYSDASRVAAPSGAGPKGRAKSTAETATAPITTIAAFATRIPDRDRLRAAFRGAGG